MDQTTHKRRFHGLFTQKQKPPVSKNGSVQGLGCKPLSAPSVRLKNPHCVSGHVGPRSGHVRGALSILVWSLAFPPLVCLSHGTPYAISFALSGASHSIGKPGFPLVAQRILPPSFSLVFSRGKGSPLKLNPNKKGCLFFFLMATGHLRFPFLALFGRETRGAR